MTQAVEKLLSKYPVPGEYMLVRTNSINENYERFLIAAVDTVKKEIKTVPETLVYFYDGSVSASFGWYQHMKAYQFRDLERVPAHDNVWRIKKRR